jgi:hypothetical protein
MVLQELLVLSVKKAIRAAILVTSVVFFATSALAHPGHFQQGKKKSHPHSVAPADQTTLIAPISTVTAFLALAIH